MLGYESTVQVTMSDMIHHAKAVRRGAPNTFMVVDIPFGAVGISEHSDLENAIDLYKQTNANAIKVEGAHLIDFINNFPEHRYTSRFTFRTYPTKCWYHWI
ncbi:3-methyl-2-oxobutanoate hydroxymethyltransferase [Staphylococcus cohnii]|nr:3-methyl-2-oxobutanoate hydroxymethyltransferase [Staphylococcus cohnii]